MDITARELNRATLGRQMLLEREPLGITEAVRRLVALQAQFAASPYLALWNRLARFRPEELDAAFADRAVVKATLMRITLHAVHADDHQVFRTAVEPTLYAARLGARFADTGLTPADAAELVPEMVRFAGRTRTAAELDAWCESRVGAERKAGAWWGLRAYAPLLHAPTGGPWSFTGRPAYVAAPARLTLAGRETDLEALSALILRYLAGFGPASVADIAQFALVQRTPIRRALNTLHAAVEELKGPDGTVLYDLPGAPRPPGDTPAPPRLMAMWDSVLLAHADRSRVIPPDYRKLVIRTNGDVLPTLLVDGRVAGVWRGVDSGGPGHGRVPAIGSGPGPATGIEVSAFHDLSPATWEAVAAEAHSLAGLLAGREPRVYGRYDHWWPKLPHTQVRTFWAAGAADASPRSVPMPGT